MKILKDLLYDTRISEIHGTTHTAVEGIGIDSREVKPMGLFIAIKGIRHDGHLFIDELYKKGFRNFLISDTKFEVSNYPQAKFLLVDDSLKAFQKIAQGHRLQFEIPIIGITGSNGKTKIGRASCRERV